MRTPDVEILWWEGCPSTERALEEVRRELAELGLAGVEVRMREIVTEADASATGFTGSPTILVDGVDVAPATAEDGGHASTEGSPTAGGAVPLAGPLTCRVYRRRDGRISPTPDPEALREALQRAVEVTT